MSQKHPLGVEKVTTLVPFIFESNPWDIIFKFSAIIKSIFLKIITSRQLAVSQKYVLHYDHIRPVLLIGCPRWAGNGREGNVNVTFKCPVLR